MSDVTEALLRGILSMTARQAFPPERLAEMVLPGRESAPLRRAFNLCDGTRTQGEIAKAAGLDSGNFSRTVARWVQDGIVLKLGTGREAKFLHVYPLAEDAPKARK